MTLGRNVKITVSETEREAIRKMMRVVLGAELHIPNDAFDVFAFADGARVGFAYVSPDQALTAAQFQSAPWIEFEVEDVDVAARRLEEMAVERVAYHDTAHRYYAAPGGPVFRLAPRP